MLSKEEVVWGYRFLLGREPESESVITAQQNLFASLWDFRQALLDSAEFKYKLPFSPDAVVYSGYKLEDLLIFDEFAKTTPSPSTGFITDFHGSRARTSSLWDGAQHLDGTVMPKPVPGDYHAEAAEWLGVLKAVLASSGRFSAMELGAGMGPWLVAGTVAARLRGIEDIRLLGVEADPVRFAFLEQNLRDNGIDPAHHILLLGGVGVRSGKAKWPRLSDPRNDAGARPIRTIPGDEDSLDKRDISYLGGLGEDLVEVDIFAFEDLLDYEPLWDLIHIDVQGTEVELCESCLDKLSSRARYLVVGTHSRKLDGDLVSLMHQAGWALEHEKPTRFIYSSQQLSLERMTTVDGIQVWRNPNL